MSALKFNYEWNVRLTSYDYGKIIQDSIKETRKPVKNGGKNKVVQMQLKFEKPIDRELYSYLVEE